MSAYYYVSQFLNVFQNGKWGLNIRKQPAPLARPSRIGMRLALPPPLPQVQMRITRPDAISGLGLRAPVPKPCSG